MPKNLKLFVRLSKIDEAQRIVYGTAVDETVDFSKEVFDYATSKPNFQKWSDAISTTTDGKSLGNLRAMHGKVAAGKLEQIAFDDDGKKIDIAAKVVDDNEWNKCLEGVYTGFSIGGSYVKKWKDGDVTRYTANPAEISLVDNPCVPTATFAVMKADGGELRKYFQPGSDLVAAKVIELAKAAGAEVTKDVKELADLEKTARAELAKTIHDPAPVTEVEEPAAKAADVKEPTSAEVVAKASEIAKAKGGNWMDYVEEAATLLKAAPAPAAAGQEPAKPAPAATEAPVVEKGAPVGAAEATDVDGAQVWISPRLPGQTFTKKADMRSALTALDTAEKAATLAKPATDALAALTKAFPPKEEKDEKNMTDDEKKAAKEKKKKDDAKADKFSADDLGKMLDGAVPIDTVEQVTAILAVEKIGEATLKQRRTVIKAARALKVVDTIPAEWLAKSAALAADASDDLKKGVHLYSLARMLELFASIQSYEADIERPETYCGCQVPAALQTRFGSMLVEFGDIIAELLDLILETIRDEEAGEAMTRAAAATDLLKGIVPTDGALAKALGKTLTPEAERIDTLEKTIVAERAAFEKTIGGLAEAITKVTADLELVKVQPLPLGSTSVSGALKVVEKSQDSGLVAEPNAADVLKDPANLAKLADIAIRNAQSRPMVAIPGHSNG